MVFLTTELTYHTNYTFIFIYIVFSVIISLILSFLSVFLRYSPTSTDLELSSAYECGFLPFDRARNKFEVKFFMVAILFVLFDLEVVFILPWSISLNFLNLFPYILMILFLGILGLSFFYELWSGALNFNS
jgi:NADH:ubiquinone oxidoreductase subunit 3 (subunit A)